MKENSKIDFNATDNIFAKTNYIKKAYKNRGVASADEAEMLNLMASDLQAVASSVERQNFDVYPKAFFGWVNISAILVLLSALIYFFIPLFAFIMLVVAAAPFLYSVLFHKGLFDKLFKKETAQNVFASVKPQAQTKARIIFCANSDSLIKEQYNSFLGFWGNFAHITVCILGYLSLLILVVARLFITKDISFIIPNLIDNPIKIFTILGIVEVAIFIVPWLAMFFMINYNKVLPSAKCNILGCETAIQLLASCSDDAQLQNIEVCTLLTGAKYFGLCGAKAWLKKNKEQLNLQKQDGIQTTFVVFDNFENFENTKFELVNAQAKTSEFACSLLQKMPQSSTASNAKKCYNMSDALVFANAGFECITASKTNLKLKDFAKNYKNDTTLITNQTLSGVLDVIQSVISAYDNNDCKD